MYSIVHTLCKNKIINKLRAKLVMILCEGHLPKSPAEALWRLIDKENQKNENEIRCDLIDAWLIAIEEINE